MENEILTENLLKKAKIKYTNFEEKLEEILTGENPRKKDEEKKKKEEEKLQKQLKNIENERKIDFILNKIPSLSYENEKVINESELKLEDLKEENEININNKNNEPFSLDYYLKPVTSNEKFSLSKERLNDSKPQVKNKTLINVEEKDDKDAKIVNNDDIIIIKKKKPISISKTEIKVDQFTNDLITQSQIENKKKEEERREKLERFKNQSLIINYQKEREINNELTSILTSNISVAQHSNFTSEQQNKKVNSKNTFYNLDSREQKLEKAREILEQKLTPNEKRQIEDLKNNIEKIKKEINIALEEKKDFEKRIKDLKSEIKNNKQNHKLFFEEYERKTKAELRSICNKFKIEIYQQDLKLTSNTFIKQESDHEIRILKEKIKKLNQTLHQKNKMFSKESNSLESQIKQINVENEEIMAKLKSYEEDRLWKKMITDNSKGKEKTLIKNVNNLTKIISQKNLLEEEEKDEILIKKKIISPNTHIHELDLTFPEKYTTDPSLDTIIKQNFQQDGTIIKVFETGKKEILFSSGQKKEVFPDGYTIITYINGDLKQIIPNYKETYYYAKDKTLQVKFSDGTVYLKYCDGRVDVITP